MSEIQNTGHVKSTVQAFERQTTQSMAQSQGLSSVQGIGAADFATRKAVFENKQKTQLNTQLPTQQEQQQFNSLLDQTPSSTLQQNASQIPSPSMKKTSQEFESAEFESVELPQH